MSVYYLPLHIFFLVPSLHFFLLRLICKMTIDRIKILGCFRKLVYLATNKQTFEAFSCLPFWRELKEDHVQFFHVIFLSNCHDVALRSHFYAVKKELWTMGLLFFNSHVKAFFSLVVDRKEGERERETDRQTETSMISVREKRWSVAFSYVPQPGIKPVAFLSTVWRSNQLGHTDQGKAYFWQVILQILH